jgi:hypothetical protein
MTSQEISKLSDQDFKTLQNNITNEFEIRKQKVIDKLRIGSEVLINHNKCRGIVYVINKINKKTIAVYEKGKPMFLSYKVVDLSLIEAI